LRPRSARGTSPARIRTPSAAIAAVFFNRNRSSRVARFWLSGRSTVPTAPLADTSSVLFPINGSTPPISLGRQLAASIRDGILNGQLLPGSRLQGSRMLASELKVSRNTVLDAYSQLLAEGYLESRIGSGTFVSNALPEDSLHARARRLNGGQRPASALLSSRGA